MLTKIACLTIAGLALSGCDPLQELGTTAAPIFFGTAEPHVPDQRLIARQAAAQALIQKGIDAADPEVSRRYIDQGVGLLQ